MDYLHEIIYRGSITRWIAVERPTNDDDRRSIR
jgi:hypothetical protein